MDYYEGSVLKVVSRLDTSQDFLYACSASSFFRNEYKLGNRVFLQVAKDIQMLTGKGKGLRLFLMRLSGYPIGVKRGTAEQTRTREAICHEEELHRVQREESQGDYFQDVTILVSLCLTTK